ncbi:hypothetical protein GNI_091260 [Gregarina niphandrodes]|uniref:Uncharacterized protein n=1 Tax=Gregarina niphandrodes TaxID=110365 RepID=A0A023B5D7_GRENI|nr:hypothetical protein GNI_091260 [Gregarina niphandrodes]EZG60042.1 hypothetical protein GNI_091260 [Gregarina niphandrodes]|eukprot:XP_011130868.1 hypothetical protein GNI_091260 [Gregarina niphandrodes]
MRRRVFRQRPIWGLDARVMTVAELSNALELDVHLMTVAELSKALDHRDQNVHTRATEEAEQETTVRLQMVDVSFESRRRVKYYNQASSLYIRTPDSKGVRRDRKEPLPDGVGKANFNFTVKGDSVLILEQTFHGREQNEKELGRIAGNPPALDPTLERALIAQGSTWLDWRSLIGE